MPLSLSLSLSPPGASGRGCAVGGENNKNNSSPPQLPGTRNYGLRICNLSLVSSDPLSLSALTLLPFYSLHDPLVLNEGTRNVLPLQSWERGRRSDQFLVPAAYSVRFGAFSSLQLHAHVSPFLFSHCHAHALCLVIRALLAV